MRKAIRIAVLGTWALVIPAIASGEAQSDRFSAGGYFRIGVRPDFQGGYSQLGSSDIYGRLLNEGPYAALELKLNLLQPDPDSDRPWAAVHAKIEGGSVQGGDALGGNLSAFRLSQLYVQAGNVLFKDVTWQLGTLDYYYGTLGLYDMRIAELFYETIGLSARWQTKHLDLLVGLGDSGWAIRGANYDTIPTLGASLKVKLIENHLEMAVGGAGYYEPQIVGDKNAPYNTPIDINYADYVLQQVAQTELLAHPDEINNFPKPVPTHSAWFKAIGYIGFGNFGPLKWDSFFINYLREPPQPSYSETYNGQQYTIYTTNLTSQRYQLNAGNEALITLIPRRLDAVWSVLYENYIDRNNTVAQSPNNMEVLSTVLRVQAYLTETLHFLCESSLARERSLNGNMFRDHADSVFQSTAGISDPRGLQYGDAAIRDTWQLKIGPVLNPTGTGIFTRPSIRILYGLQYSTQNEAFGNAFVSSLDENNVFRTTEQHWHQVIALEAEAWF